MDSPDGVKLSHRTCASKISEALDWSVNKETLKTFIKHKV